jgi:hypothetical protein
MSSFRYLDSSVPVPSATVEVAPVNLVGLLNVDFGLVGVAPGTRLYIRANYPGPTALPDTGADADWLLYTRSVLSVDLRYTGDDGMTFIIETTSVEQPAGTPEFIDSLPFWIPGKNYPFRISGMELPPLAARFYVVTEANNTNERIRGSVMLRGL